jgi:hypothetical protein
MNLLLYTFPTRYCVPKIEIVCQSYALENLIRETTQNGVHKTLGFSSSGVRVLGFLDVKMPLEPHCNSHLLVNERSHHISSQR